MENSKHFPGNVSIIKQNIKLENSSYCTKKLFYLWTWIIYFSFRNSIPVFLFS